jgi:hypothetical protein
MGDMMMWMELWDLGVFEVLFVLALSSLWQPYIPFSKMIAMIHLLFTFWMLQLVKLLVFDAHN